MKDYDTSIIVTSAMKYNKKNGGEGTRLEVLLTDPEMCGANGKFVGCVPVTLWYGSSNVFDLIVDHGLILKPCIGHFNVRKDFKDPTKTTSSLESINYKDNVITLVQPNA